MARKQVRHCQEAKKPRPEMEQTAPSEYLDSRRAWLVLLVLFVITSSLYGSSRVYGLVFARQVKQAADESQERESASWPLFTCSTVELLASILTPALAGRLSWRQLEFIAALLFGLSNLGAFFSRSLAIDTLCLGLIQGLAVSIHSVITLAIVNHYFRRYRTTAFGLALSGSTCGLVYLAPLANWLLDSDFGDERQKFRLVYLALAACSCVNLALVMFLKPASWWLDESPDEQIYVIETPERPEVKEKPPDRKVSRVEWYLERDESIASISLQCKTRRISTMHRQINGNLSDRKRGGLNKSQSAAAQLDTWWPSARLFAHKISTHSLLAGHQLGDLLAIGLQSTGCASQRNLARKELVVSPRSIDTPKGCSWAEDANRDMQSAHAVHDIEDQPAKEGHPRQTTTSIRGEEGLARSLLELIRNPWMHCVWILLSLYYLISRLFIIVLADFGADRGLSPGESSSLLNYWSAGELFGRLVLAALIDFRWFSMRTCLSAVSGLLAILMSMLVLLLSEAGGNDDQQSTAGLYIWYAIGSFLIASLVSLEYVLINAFMVEYLGASKATSCYSLAAFIAAFLLAARPKLIGLFRDRLGSYDELILVLAGSAFTFALLFFLLEPLFKRRWPRRAETAPM